MYLEDIARELKVSVYSLKLYLCRGEFNKNRTKHSYIYDMSKEDLEHLGELIRNKNGAKRNTYNTIKEDC